MPAHFGSDVSGGLEIVEAVAHRSAPLDLSRFGGGALLSRLGGQIASCGVDGALYLPVAVTVPGAALGRGQHSRPLAIASSAIP